MDAVDKQAPRPTDADIVADFVVRLTDSEGNLVNRTFAEPVTIEFTIPADQVPDGASSETLLVAYWDGEAWQMVEGTTALNEDGSAAIVVRVAHFTLFSVFDLPGAGRFADELLPDIATFTTWGGGTLNALRDALARDAGQGGRLWVLVDGAWRSYMPAAPDFVNAGFLPHFPNGLQPSTPVVVVR